MSQKKEALSEGGERVKARDHEKNKTRYFQSGVFKRLFLSHAMIILLVFGLFVGWSLVSYQREAAQLKEREWEQRAASWGTWMDQQLMQAQSLCAAVNISENARDILQTAYVEKKTINAMQLYNMLGELNRIKATARNVSIYSLMLTFQGDNKAYLPGSVISFEGNCQVLESLPWFGVSTAADLLGIKGTQILLNKEYLIYGEGYNGFGARSSTKGQVLVLLEQDTLLAALRERAGSGAGIRILRRGQPAFSAGEVSEHAFSVNSLNNSSVEYILYAPDSDFRIGIPGSVLIPIGISILASAMFLFMNYRIATRYYKPIDKIQQMITKPADESESGEAGKQGNEFDHILDGISSLIGERNGYREKMVTITPYARQGMLQAVIRGVGKPETLVEEQFTELKRNYYMVGVINIAITRDTPAAERRYRDLQELILSVCRGMSGEEIQVSAVPENLQNIFVLAASDERDVFENFFYRLYEAIQDNVEDESTVITIGTGHRENDIDQLGAACREANASLGQMLTGGRGSVYFPENREESHPGYYFPKDAQKQIVRLIKERDLGGLNGLLDEIYQKNLVDADLPPSEIRQLADELYWTIRKALRNASDLNMTHVRMEPIRDAATIDEIFAYYRQVFVACVEEIPNQEGEKGESNLEEEFCRFLEEHLYDPELSLNSAADQFGVSTKMIGLICKKRYGQTFLSYVRDRQIHHAVELLQKQDLSVEEISAQCGFTNILTFRRNFKAVMGVNPSEYRGETHQNESAAN